MVDIQNPYVPPNSDILNLSERQDSGVNRVFSPMQGVVGALLGGPLAGTYIVVANYRALGEMRRARLSTSFGIVISAAILVCDFFVPNRIFGYGISIACGIAAWLTITRTQFTRQQILASGTLKCHPNWMVAVITMLGLLITFVLAHVLSDLLNMT